MEQELDKNPYNSTVSIMSKEKDDSVNKFEILPQIFAVTVKNILLLPIGMNIGFITILIPRLLTDNENGHFVLTDEIITWIGSAMPITACIGSLASGFVSDPFGRKRVMILITFPFLISWLSYYFATKIWHLFFALLLNGLSGGLIGAAVYSYVAEITQPHLRGLLTATSALSIFLGIFIEICLGTLLAWRTVALLSGIVPIIAFVFLWFLPESPHWLLSKNRKDEAIKSLAWYRGWTSTESVTQEFNYINDDYQKKRDELKGVDKSQYLRNKLKLFVKRGFLYPLFLVTFLQCLVNFSGSVTLQTYAVLIFATLNVPINKYYATLTMGACEIVGCVISIILARCVGRRKMGLYPLIGVTLCNLLIGVYAFVNDISQLLLQVDFENVSFDDIKDHQWIPLFLVLLISFFVHCGLKSVPWILVGEVFSFETRSFGTGLCSALFSVIQFVANKIFLDMVVGLTFPGVYWFHACVGCVGFLVIYFAVPETEGKSLQEISDHFEGRVKLNNSIKRHSKVQPDVVSKL